MLSSPGSILDILKYHDTCEHSISILGGIAILRYIEYRSISVNIDRYSIYRVSLDIDRSDDSW